MKTFLYCATILLVSCILMSSKVKKTDFIDNLEWSYIESNNNSFSRGVTWRFFRDHSFQATNWYSGGAYFNHHYKGTYVYDAANEIVYLTYHKDPKLPPITTKLSVQLIKVKDHIDQVIFYDNWEEKKGHYTALQPQVVTLSDSNLTIPTSTEIHFYRKQYFKIVKIEN